MQRKEQDEQFKILTHRNPDISFLDTQEGPYPKKNNVPARNQYESERLSSLARTYIDRSMTAIDGRVPCSRVNFEVAHLRNRKTDAVARIPSMRVAKTEGRTWATRVFLCNCSQHVTYPSQCLHSQCLHIHNYTFVLVSAATTMTETTSTVKTVVNSTIHSRFSGRSSPNRCLSQIIAM